MNLNPDPKSGSLIFLCADTGRMVPSDACSGSLKSRKPPGPLRILPMNWLIRLDGLPLQRGSLAIVPETSMPALVYVSVGLVGSEAFKVLSVQLAVSLNEVVRVTMPPSLGPSSTEIVSLKVPVLV